MIVFLSPTRSARLGDLDRLDRLHAECDGDPADVRLAPWCRLDDDGEHLWLDIAACREIGATAEGDGWAEQYDGMIAYASSKGWTDPAGTAVRAHLERTDRDSTEPPAD